MRWSEFLDGKRKQPSHRLASVKNYLKESEVRPLAEDYMAKVRKTQTTEAGASVKEFVDNVYFPKIKAILAKGTVALYRQAWKRLESHLGHMRVRDVRVADVQARHLMLSTPIAETSLAMTYTCNAR